VKLATLFGPTKKIRQHWSVQQVEQLDTVTMFPGGRSRLWHWCLVKSPEWSTTLLLKRSFFYVQTYNPIDNNNSNINVTWFLTPYISSSSMQLDW